MKKKITRFLRKLIKTVLKDIRYTIGHPQAVQLGLVVTMAAVLIGLLLFNVMVYAFHAETTLATFVVVHLFLGFLSVFGNVLALKYHTNAVGLALINAILWLLTKGITSLPSLIPNGAIDVQMVCGLGFALKWYQLATKPAANIASCAATAYSAHHNVSSFCKSRSAKARYDKVLYLGRECFVWGRRTSGSFFLRTVDGTKVKDGVGYRNLTLLERSTNYLIA